MFNFPKKSIILDFLSKKGCKSFGESILIALKTLVELQNDESFYGPWKIHCKNFIHVRHSQWT